ncbi:UNVERIFIED_CONTAM: Cilia- and flagella-associated protein 43, partial [Siphonaria sp. JEL0065]
MPPTLFGELEVSKSYGHTPLTNPCYIAPHVLCYVSGNALNFLDTSARGAAALSKHTNTRPIIADSQITAFGVCRRESLIAYAERGHTTVQIVKYPLGSIVGHFDQENDKDVILTAIEFSHDAKYLASLSGLPNYRVTVWDWKNNTMMAYVDSATPANSISFNPFNSLQFCTGFNSSVELEKDDERGIKFWKLEMGFKNNSLKTISGHECCLQEQPPIDPKTIHNDIHISHTSEFYLFPRSHAWQIDQQVLVTVETGDAVVQYNPVNGESRLLFSVWKSRYQVEIERSDTAVIEEKRGVVFALDSGGESTEDIVLDEDQKSGNDLGELTRNDFLKKEYGGAENFKCILATKDSIILGGKDGVLRFVNYDGEILNQVHVVNNGAEITAMTFSPDFKEVSVTASDKCIYTCELSTHNVTQNLEIDSFGVVSLALFQVSDFVVTAHKDGTLKFWDPDTKRISNRFSVSGDITAIAAHPLSSVLAVGTKCGVLRIFDVAFASSDQPRLLMREKVSTVAIKQLIFDPTGRYLISFGKEECAVLVDIMKKCTILGFIHTRYPITSAVWDIEESEDNESENGIATNLFLYVLNHHGANTSNILKYNVPLDKEVPEGMIVGFQLDKFVKMAAKYRIDEVITDFVVVSSGVSSSRSFYAVSDDKKLKNFGRPSGSYEDASDYINLGTPILEFADHEKKYSKLILSLSTEWLFSYSPDGTITARNFLEPEKSTKVFGHDSAIGGVQQLAISRDVHKLYSIGYDGIVRLFEWKSHMAVHRRALIEAAEAAEIAFGSKLEAIKNVVVSLNQTPTRNADPEDSASEKYYFDKIATAQSGAKATAATEKDGTQTGFDDKIKVIRERLTKAMQRNETLPELEKIPKSDFILDFAERDRLMAEADARVKQVRKEIELENLKKRVIRNRIKAECWDSMEVIGASIKSFRPDPTTTRIAEVTNFPIKKKSPQEIQRIEKVKILRKIQLHVEAAEKKDNTAISAIAAVQADDVVLDSATTEAPPPIAEVVTYNDFKSLLYNDFELTTNQRKRTQIILLGEAINEIKATITEFNSKFKDFCKFKKDEILKIEDKNERILNITSELQIQEAIFKPVLDDDEVPERIIEVHDDEVKAEKFIGPEELKRIEARKREEEERRRAAQEDNYRERGLMIMM